MIKPVAGDNAAEGQHNWLNQFHDGQTACCVYSHERINVRNKRIAVYSAGGSCSSSSVSDMMCLL